MPIPILAAIAIGGLVGGGATAVYKDSKHKKEVAELQDMIFRLQTELEESHMREKELIIKIRKLEKDKETMLHTISELTGKVQKYDTDMEAIKKKLEANNSRWKVLISKITFRMKQLEQGNMMLKEQLSGIAVQRDGAVVNLEGSKNKLSRYEKRHKKLVDDLDETRTAIESMEDELSVLEDAC